MSYPIRNCLNVLLSSALLLAGWQASAHELPNDPFVAHWRQDFVPQRTWEYGSLRKLLDTSQRYSRWLGALNIANAHAAAEGDPGSNGHWSDIIDWPLVPLHVALLPNGKVLAYDSVGLNAAETYTDHSFTRATIWDPLTGSQTEANVNTGYNLFCSGFALLPEGRLFVAGGTADNQLNGSTSTQIFDPANNTWSLGPYMSQGGRWYPSVTPLANGEMLITSGGPATPEVRQTDGNLRPLSSAALSLPLYPWMHVAPDGRVAYFGPNQTLRSLATEGSGAWESYGQRDDIDRTYGGFALYDIGKVLVAGGGPSTASAMIVDLAKQQASATGSMSYGRRQLNLTILADGSVLATGGNSNGTELVDVNAGVYAAERWDPSTGQWTVLARMQRTRQYHSTALLLADGRVLVGGGGVCAVCTQQGYSYTDAEIYSPPYLFKKDGSGQPASRPTITAAPGVAGYGRSIQIATPDAASISKVALLRTGSVTHSTNFTQRYIPLAFATAKGGLKVKTPANANIAPPGYYLLFIVRNGVPSVGQFLQVDGTVSGDNQPPLLTGPGNQTSPLGTTVDLGVQASDPEGGTLTFSASGLPPGLQMDAGSGQISGAPTTLGSYYVTLTVADRQGGYASAAFVWLIAQEAAAADLSPGLVYEYYEGVWRGFPDLDAATPLANGIVKRIKPGPRQRDDQFALRFRGKLRIPQDGDYTFYLNASAAARLWIDGNLLIKSGNGQSAREIPGSTPLTAGDHEVTVAYVNRSATPILGLALEGPELAKQTVPSAWWHQASRGVAYQYYEGRWKSLPPFNALVPVKSGFISVFDLAPRQRYTHFALLFNGKLRVGQRGKYTFYLRSKTGSELWIDGKQRISESGPGEGAEKAAKVQLDAGDHSIQLGYFQSSGPRMLGLDYSGPGVSRQPLGVRGLSEN